MYYGKFNSDPLVSSVNKCVRFAKILYLIKKGSWKKFLMSTTIGAAQ